MTSTQSRKGKHLSLSHLDTVAKMKVRRDIQCISVWVYGCMGVWVYECMGVWVYECMGIWVYEYMSVWVYECMGVWVYGCMSVWVHGCMGVWVYECTCCTLCVYNNVIVYNYPSTYVISSQERASHINTFIYVKIPQTTLCITYKVHAWNMEFCTSLQCHTNFRTLWSKNSVHTCLL